tara:strand:+ start:1296 stop:2060 length:765 start_codon:yes stop_codon:yes gene_type:complete
MKNKNLIFSTTSEAKLTIIGVGPGDPSLLTLAAVQAIQDSSVVAYPISKEGQISLAANIASRWISDEKIQIPLVFPMVVEVEKLRKAWRYAGDQLAKKVANGHQVVFLCQGDVSLFATSSYLLLDIKSNHPKCPIKVIPGINSFSAAAAIAHLPLAIHQEQLLIMPTPEHEMALETLLKEAFSAGRVLVLLKLGKRWPWVRDVLARMNLLEDALIAQRIGFPDEKIIKSSEMNRDECPYFSLLIIRQSWPALIN